MLTWATVSENNSKQFIIERSLDGIQFTQIGSVQASGNSYHANNYNYTDYNITALNAKVLYYRLRQEDLDGKFLYSAVVVLSLKINSLEPGVVAVPNPFTQTINLQIINVADRKEKDKVELYSLEGRLLYQRTIINRGSATILLDNLPILSPGMYLLKAILNEKVFTIKLTRK